MTIKSTQQESSRKGIGNPNPSPETRFGGIRANPQSPGGWKKEESISYQYNRFGRMSDKELENYIPTTQFEKIALLRIKEANKATGLGDAKEITDRTEGKAPQHIDMTSNGETIGKTVEVVWAAKKKQSK